MAEATPTDPFSVDGHDVVIIGGTAGIGLAVAQRMVDSGASVIVTGRRADGETRAAGVGAGFVTMDVADRGSVAEGFDAIRSQMPHIDCLILNAGIDLHHGRVDKLDLDNFERVFDINTMGLVRAMSHGSKMMSAGGSVVVTSSPAGSVAVPGMAAYSASKAALDMLVRSWALELGPKQIRVNAVLPGIVESEMSGESTGDLEVIRRMTANGVFRRAEEMGPVFQFLASSASATLTGSALGAHDGISIGYSQEVMTHIAQELPES